MYNRQSNQMMQTLYKTVGQQNIELKETSLKKLFLKNRIHECTFLRKWEFHLVHTGMNMLKSKHEIFN